MFPGSLIIWHFLPETDANLMFGLILLAFGSLLATVLLAFAHDSQGQMVGPRNIEISAADQDVLPPATPESVVSEKPDCR